jgi:hypothetical protein
MHFHCETHFINNNSFFLHKKQAEIDIWSRLDYDP